MDSVDLELFWVEPGLESDTLSSNSPIIILYTFLRTRPIFYQRKTNTIFRFAVETHHRVSVQIGDKMDLICPRYDDQMDHNGHMYHRIYQVTEEAFRLVFLGHYVAIYVFGAKYHKQKRQINGVIRRWESELTFS